MIVNPFAPMIAISTKSVFVIPILLRDRIAPSYKLTLSPGINRRQGCRGGWHICCFILLRGAVLVPCNGHNDDAQCAMVMGGSSALEKNEFHSHRCRLRSKYQVDLQNGRFTTASVP